MHKLSILSAAIALIATGTALGQESAPDNAPTVGAVFAATNGATRNEVVMYSRSTTGALNYIGHFATGGRGQGGINDPLQAQRSLLLSPDHQYLLAVNAGSSTLSVFRVFSYGLELLDTKPTHGGNPVSITMHGNLVYVANVGGNYHTAGFHLQQWGALEFIENSKQHLSGLDTEPGAIAFSPDGTKVIVTERQTNKIDVFSVADDGGLTQPIVNTAQGIEPFGASFAPSGALLVSEAGSGDVSSYAVNADNSLSVITSKSPSSGAATCWIIPDGKYAYATSAITSSISGYKLGPDGSLIALGIVLQEPGKEAAIFPPVGVTAFPLDIEATADHRLLYVVYSALGEIIGYRKTADGGLNKVSSVKAYEPQIGVEGLAVY